MSKSPGGYAIYERVLEMKNFTPAYMKGWTCEPTHTGDFLKTKMSWMLFGTEILFSVTLFGRVGTRP